MYLYSAQSLEKMRFIDTDAWVTAFAVSPDSATLASGFEDGSIWLWRIFDGSPLAKCAAIIGKSTPSPSRPMPPG